MDLLRKLEERSAVIGIIGLGYVGLPIARAFSRRGFEVMGFDIDPRKVEMLQEGRSYVRHIPAEDIREMLEAGFDPTTDYDALPATDAVLICVPTPLGEHQEPNLTYIEQTTRSVAEHLRAGQLIVLESTTYPGTTSEVMLPILCREGLRVGEDFYLGYSPEREDPGNPRHTMESIPKVVSGVTERCLRLTRALYDQVVVETVPVSSTETAEATKLTENIYRAVNIALVNELKTLFHRMDIDVFEVIGAASTKPFGFHPFYPGPGLGGHCIPIDPFYLSWRAREFDHSARFIHLAGEINTSMPQYVIYCVAEALNTRRKALNGSQVLLLGMAYKSDVDDIRESPSLKLMELLEEGGARVPYHDPYVPELSPTRDYDFHKESVPLTAEVVGESDLVLISTVHANVDYEMVRREADLIVDTRNVYPGAGIGEGKIFQA